MDSLGQHPVHEVVEHGIVEEHLGHQEIAPSLHFHLGMLQIFIQPGSFRMAFRVGSTSHTEIPVALDFLYQVAGMGIISQRMFLPLGQISPEGQHVLDMGRLQLIQDSFYFLFVGAHTSEMGQGRNPAPFDFRYQRHAFSYGSPAGAVGDAHVINTLDGDGPDDFLGMFQLTAFLGREQFTGYANLWTLQQVYDFQKKYPLTLKQKYIVSF